MRVTLSADKAIATETDLLVVGTSTNKTAKDPELAKLDKALGGVLEAVFKDEGFAGKRGRTVKIPARGRVKAKWVVVVGIKGLSDVDAARALGHAAAKASTRQKSAAIVLSAISADTVRAATEATMLGTYRYSDYKTGSRKPKGGLSKALLLVGDPKDAALRDALKAGQALADSIALARDLVNGPPNDLNPITLAEIAKTEAEKLGLKVTIWGKKQIEKAGMRLFLAVNRGSALEPRFIHISYVPEGPAPKGGWKKVAFVGKGLTFDSGGLCIKPPKSMIDMKCDMAGAATTLGIVLAAARLKLPVAVDAIIGSTENMTGAAAYRPGDVFTSLDGKTVEIINTDAEGRLVLADVLAWTRDNLTPDVMIDHATLTGACMVALGAHRAAFYTDDEELASGYSQAAGEADERYWRMPLDKDLRSTLESPIADLKHTGSSYGGSITAGLFLQEFVGKVPWIHCDIAGPAFNDSSHGRAPKGGTGFGVATGVSFLEQLSAAPAPE